MNGNVRRSDPPHIVLCSNCRAQTYEAVASRDAHFAKSHT